MENHLEDIALFFNLNGNARKCWVKKSVYTDPSRKLEKLDPYWKKAVLSEDGEGATYYVTNLSKLLPAGVSPSLDKAGLQQKAAPTRPTTAAPVFAEGDLVVIPQATPDSAFLVKKAEYQDETICPNIPEKEAADLKFLALTQGTVLANVPKEDITGMSCFLLNLLGLNSGAVL